MHASGSSPPVLLKNHEASQDLATPQRLTLFQLVGAADFRSIIVVKQILSWVPPCDRGDGSFGRVPARLNDKAGKKKKKKKNFF